MSLKYGIGILTYDTTNIGDWAQSAATLYLWWLYFNKPMSFKDFILMSIETSYIDKYPLIWIDRDSISLTNKPDNVDKVILICNAWWLHWKADDNKYLFPPPTWIEPICTSMHFCNKDIFDATTTAYLKKSY
jgi:hypothetical protein